ncbi:Uncharacterised protein [Chlamydia trachomatis]|nr:Uncharacterised protein [Chlamydia trachomatis]
MSAGGAEIRMGEARESLLDARGVNLEEIADEGRIRLGRHETVFTPPAAQTVEPIGVDDCDDSVHRRVGPDPEDDVVHGRDERSSEIERSETPDRRDDERDDDERRSGPADDFPPGHAFFLSFRGRRGRNRGSDEGVASPLIRRSSSNTDILRCRGLTTVARTGGRDCHRYLFAT